MKPICPQCGNALTLNIVLRACKVIKINKDGTLSKRSKNILNGDDTDIIYLGCNCGFSYNLSYTDNEPNEAFDDWYNNLQD